LGVIVSAVAITFIGTRKNVENDSVIDAFDRDIVMEYVNFLRGKSGETVNALNNLANHYKIADFSEQDSTEILNAIDWATKDRDDREPSRSDLQDKDRWKNVSTLEGLRNTVKKPFSGSCFYTHDRRMSTPRCKGFINLLAACVASIPEGLYVINSGFNGYVLWELDSRKIFFPVNTKGYLNRAKHVIFIHREPSDGTLISAETVRENVSGGSLIEISTEAKSNPQSQ
jgi:hypothetical protein